MIAGRYRLAEPLGVGGMSSVWKAEDLELERLVALKILARDADRPRFEREARAAAALAHPNVCQLWDFGESEEGPYMALEYLPGGTLEDRLDGRAPLPDEETRRIATEVAAGLAAAHAQGLVHRDLKPANVLFDEEGRAKIADFGIARVGGAGTITEAGTVMGTAAYISPEQATGEVAGPASDVYSFGVIVFRMLTGRLPFEAPEPIALVRMHATEPAPHVADVRPDAPADLAAVAAAALRKDPAERPADGKALLAALAGGTTMGAGETVVLPAAAGAATRVAAAPAGAAVPARRRAGRAALVAATVLLLALAGGALALVAAGGGDGEVERTEPPQSTTRPATTTTGETTEPADETEPAPAPAPPPATTADTEPATTERTTPTATTAPRTATTATTPEPAPPPPPQPPPTTTPPTEPPAPPTTAPTTATTTAGGG